MYIEFLRSIPPDKLKEVKSNIDKKIGEAFQEDLEEMRTKIQAAKEEEYRELAQKDNQLFRLALIMKQHNLTSTFELDRVLRKYDSSLRQQQQAYLERKLGQQQLYKSIEFQPEVTHEEMLEDYRANQQEFQVATRARWEQLSARFDKFPEQGSLRPGHRRNGQRSRLGRAPFWAVAKRRSQGPNAEQGGYQDWKAMGDLSLSRAINEAVFSLPVQQMSGIIEDFEGLHIIRVIERTEAHLIPFTEAQVEIKEKLQQKKRSEEIAAYIVRLRSRTPIWTIYDGEDLTRNEPRQAVQPELNR